MKRVTDDGRGPQDHSPAEPPPKRMRHSMDLMLHRDDVPTSSHSNLPGEFSQIQEDYLLKTGRNWKIFTDKELPGAEVFYLPSLIDEVTANMWNEELGNLESWYRPTLKVHGHEVTQSRSIAAYSTTPDLTVKYSGQIVQMHYPYPGLVRDIQRLLERTLGFVPEGGDEDKESDRLVAFNHVLLNKYENGDVYIGQHSDSRENKVIASLSLGAPRTFIMTPRKGCPGKRLKWTLENGSLLVMQGETQLNWKHEIPKEPKVKNGRISLTFRQLATKH